MLVILQQEGCEGATAKTVSDIGQAFKGEVDVRVIEAKAATKWPSPKCWDDLLVVIYAGGPFPQEGDQFIADYIAERGENSLVLPVAIDLKHKKPPGSAAAIKALEYDSAATGLDGRLIKRIGAMLGLRVEGRDTKIFISYRQNDGLEIARQIYDHLIATGHTAFLDEAKEVDGETTIIPGSDVQKQIDESLENANLLILLDTPNVASSPWIKHEVETATSLMLPILPICFRDVTDHMQGPRFRSLRELQRWISLPLPSPTEASPLTERQLDDIVVGVETFLSDLFRRKCRVPFIVRTEFVSRDFDWNTLDRKLLMYESSKVHGERLKTTVCSHCSIFEQIHGPSLKRFSQFLEQKGRANFSLFIYDGDLLSSIQLKEFSADCDDAIILHHQELAVLLDSGFTALGSQ